MLKILCFILLIMGGVIYCQNPNDDNNRYLLGENYEQAGYSDKAKEIYEDFYRKNSSNPEYFISLNRIYVLLKKYDARSEEHTSELQSLRHLVCRLLLEK